MIFYSALWTADVMASALAAMLCHEGKGNMQGMTEQRDRRNHIYGVAVPAMQPARGCPSPDFFYMTEKKTSFMFFTTIILGFCVVCN